MIHVYKLHGFAPEPGYLRWICRDCPRVVDLNRQTGAIEVIYAGAESCIHGGFAIRANILCLFFLTFIYHSLSSFG